MKNIAFIYTKYQQNILFAICLQESMHIDVLFLKKNIPLHGNAKSYVDKVVYYEDIPFSWRSIWKYYHEYKSNIALHIDPKSTYKIFTWSIVNPLCRYAINSTQCHNINIIEDGSGSYLKWGFNNYNSGFKTFAVSTLIFLSTNVLSCSLLPIKCSRINGWSLFDGCYPDFEIKKNIIEHNYFQKILADSMRNVKVGKLEKDSIVFIQSAYIEAGLLSQKDYLRIHIEAIKKIKKYYEADCIKLHWSLHPKTDIENELMRIKKIEEEANVSIKPIQHDISVEMFAMGNVDNALRYFSLGSSSLYVIRAISAKSDSVFLVESNTLNEVNAIQSTLTSLYRTIGITII